MGNTKIDVLKQIWKLPERIVSSKRKIFFSENPIRFALGTREVDYAGKYIFKPEGGIASIEATERYFNNLGNNYFGELPFYQITRKIHPNNTVSVIRANTKTGVSTETFYTPEGIRFFKEVKTKNPDGTFSINSIEFNDKGTLI